ncbi:DegT/DnrJ/EryC1/StrS family aminotransferase [Candidatus Parcubacteria bacterium]|nr:DegT/DnrJ/EryC1/StrS family aminotransferase [Candidatus Parcubacteria bacterium]
MLEIVKKIKSEDTFFFYRGRVALYATLKAMGVKEGDEAILQAFTCLAVPAPIIFLGAIPVYVDIDPKTFNINPSRIEEKITQKTKVIIVQHTFGIPAPMDEILNLAKKYHLYVIEDSCHTFGSKYKGKEVGTFGDASFYSFEWGKPLIIGLGGCVVINNPEIKKRLEKIYNDFVYPSKKEVLMIRLQYYLHSLFLKPSLFWRIREIYRFLSKLGFFIGTFEKEELRGEVSLDYRKRMSRYHKNFLLKKLDDLDRMIAHRKWIISEYEKLLPKIGYPTLRLSQDFEPIYLRYPILVENKEIVLKKAIEEKIELGDWFLSPIHPLKEKEWTIVKYKKGSCPIAEDTSKKIITLPIHEKIGKREINKIASFLSKLKIHGT